MLKALSELHDMARSHEPRRLVLAAAHDEHSLGALVHATKQRIVEGILIGDQKLVEDIANAHGFDLGVFHLINEPDNDLAAAKAVKLVRENQADILMKGNLRTSSLIRAVLHKENGLRSEELISHLALFQVNNYHKLIGITDAAMNIYPDIQGKVSIINNAVGFLHRLGLEIPKVALLSAVETVNPKMKSGVEAAIITKMAERGQINGCLVDGPLAFDNAICEKSARLKKISSQVAGDADLLVADNIEVANSIYKSLIYFARASCAAVILGTVAPIVLTSRADPADTKLNSIAMAAAIS
jgi:phosphate butyryltransferase